MINNLQLRSVVYILSLFLVAACGGGGGGSSSANMNAGLSVVTLNEMRGLRAEYKEGEAVVLQLDVSGEAADDLSYNWEVDHEGEQLEIFGQNSSTISFVAPDVDVVGTVSVNVTIELQEGRLLGENRQYFTLKVVDLDPVEASSLGIIKPGLATDLPQVNRLNFKDIESDTVWLLNIYQLSSTDHLGYLVQQYLAAQIITYFEFNDTSDLTYRRCGRDTQQSFFAPRPDIGPVCMGVLERKYYQTADAFRIEDVCDGEVEYVSNFTKLSDDVDASFGSVDLTFNSYDDMQINEGVCGLIAEVVALSHEDRDGDGHPDNQMSETTVIELNTDLNGEDFQIVASFNDVRSVWRYTLFDFLGADEQADLTITSDALERISGERASDGNLSLDRKDEKTELQFNAEIEDSYGAEEDVSGQIKLLFY